MDATTHYDVIIIGTGAGGGTLLHRLAPSGKRILVLERGGFLRREPENWDSKAVLLDARYRAAEQWRDRVGRTFRPHIQYCVGGNTKFYGAALLRMRRADFGELRHAGGLSPAWPVSYDDLAPYYTEAEYLYRVHGLRGSDPTEPEADAPYPEPPVSQEPRMQALMDGFRRVGTNPFPLPMGIMLDERNPARSACVRCATCDGFPCLVNAKADAHVVCVLPALLEHPNVTLLTDALVTRLETSASGREVTAVHVERDGAPERYSADLVVVSCGAVNSAALLLRSAGERHPNGLANASGAVGRHYMAHNNSAVLALSRVPNPTVFQKTFAINDYYFRDGDWEFPLGHISFVGKLDANALAEGAPSFAPRKVLAAIAAHSIDFWLTTEDLPDPENRVTLERDGGIRLSYRENNLEGHRRLVATLKHLLGRIDGGRFVDRSLFLAQKIPLEGTAHQCGTVRFGNDPATSALDANCRAHEVDNLYVVDGSFFVSSSSVNPALTIMANALRVGDHLLERLQASRPAWSYMASAAAGRAGAGALAARG